MPYPNQQLTEIFEQIGNSVRTFIQHYFRSNVYNGDITLYVLVCLIYVIILLSIGNIFET